MEWLWRRLVALPREPEASLSRSKARRKGPRPLRSAAYPLGLPGLRGVDRTRVLQANKLYRFCREVMGACHERNILCMVEDPENRLLWLTRYMLNPPSSFRRHCLRACMYGSKRLKKTAFLINFDAPNMRVACDDSHPHLPWSNRLEVDPSTKQTRRVFDAASEAEYPKGLCDAIATAFSLELQARGVTWNMEAAFADEAALLSTNKQPRGQRSPVLVSEFKHKIQISVPGHVQLPELITKDSDSMFQGLPLGSKLVTFQHVVKEGKTDAEKVAIYRVYRTPEEFLQEALKLRHPFNIPVSNDLDNISAISQILSLGKLGVMKVRLERLIHYKRLAESLEAGENELKSAMRPDLRKIMGAKRLLLFKQMLEDANVGDEHLFSELTHGFRLTGQLEASGQFRPRFKPAQ